MQARGRLRHAPLAAPAKSASFKSRCRVGTWAADPGGTRYAGEIYVVFSPFGRRPLFHRGDPNDDGKAGLSDAVAVLGHLFLGGEALRCRESADLNNDGAVNITDPIFLLGHLFLGGPAPPEPGPPGAGLPAAPCGADPDPPGSAKDLGCQGYEHCP